MTKLMKSFFAATSLLLLLPMAQAQTQTTFDFGNLPTSTTGFLPSNGTPCTNGDLCSSAVGSGIFSGNLTFAVGSLSVDATASYNNSTYGVNAAVVQDHYDQGRPGGLGVYHELNNADDNISKKESLKLSFNTSVALSAIALRDKNHEMSWSNGATFEYSTNNTNWVSALLPRNTPTGMMALNLTGQDFYFRYGGVDKEQFYLNAVTVAAVPEPETYAMLLAGLGLIGMTSRKRQQAKA